MNPKPEQGDEKNSEKEHLSLPDLRPLHRLNYEQFTQETSRIIQCRHEASIIVMVL